MAVRYTEEQLNTVDKSLLIQMILNQQERAGDPDRRGPFPQ
ncbi:MAG: hypothetical protein ACLTC8_01660 [Lachnospiraceae bacterium]